MQRYRDHRVSDPPWCFIEGEMKKENELILINFKKRLIHIKYIEFNISQVIKIIKKERRKKNS